MRLSFSSLILACSAAFLGAPAHANVVGADPFTYDNGAIVGRSGGAGWNWDNAAQTLQGSTSSWVNVFNEQNVNIVDNALVTADGGARRAYHSDETTAALQAEGVIYYAVNMTRQPGVDWGGVSAYDFDEERIFWGVPGTQGQDKVFGIDVRDQGITFSTVPVVPGQTYRLVTRLDFENDQVALWVDPTNEDLANPDVVRAYTATNWNTGVRLASGGAGSTTWDNLLVATTWSDVVPVPEPSTLSLTLLAAATLLTRRRA